MPSSLIFVGLVVLWLLILVPIVARRRQEVPRPGHAARAGRVLQRPVRRSGRVEEMDDMELDKDELDDQGPQQTDAEAAVEETSVDEGEHAAADGEVEPAEDGADGAALGGAAGETAEGDSVVAAAPNGDAVTDRAEADRAEADSAGADSAGADGAEADGPGGAARVAAPSVPSHGYRRGRGGFDPEAAELAASARYAFRQRVVLTLLIAALGTGIVAAIGLPVVWYLHGAIDLALVGYLIYLRRQVRLEDEIRFRRAARVAGSRFAHVGSEPLNPPSSAPTSTDEERPEAAGPAEQAAGSSDPASAPEQPAEPALPPLPRAELPGRPRGTTVVGPDDEDPALHQLDDQLPPRYRRAAG